MGGMHLFALKEISRKRPLEMACFVFSGHSFSACGTGLDMGGSPPPKSSR